MDAAVPAEAPAEAPAAAPAAAPTPAAAPPPAAAAPPPPPPPPPAEEAPAAAPAPAPDSAAPAAAAAAGAPPSDAAVAARLREILAEVDLSVTTVKMLRRRLEAELSADLSSKKDLLRAEVDAYLDAQAPAGDAGGAGGSDAEAGGSDDDDAPAAKRARGGGNAGFGSVLSAEMAAFLGLERCPRTQVVKKLWEYIKEKELQDPKDRRKILLDARLAKLFPGKSVNMFSMQKHLSKHCFTDDTGGGSGEERPARRARAPAAARPRKAAAAAGGADGDAPKKPNGFQKQMRLSEEMAAWVGKPSASRPEITKHLWAYVKERELQDPENKSFVLADAPLRALTGEARFKAFGFASLIKEHILGAADAE
jgi:upstream activation factor subunit UAF30